MAQGVTKSILNWPILLSLLVVLCGLDAPAALTPQTTSAWQTIAVSDLFSFRLPQGFKKRVANEERGEYYNGETKVVFVWRPTQSPAYRDRQQSWMKDYQETTTRLGGRQANIRSYWTEKGKRIYHAELNVGNWEKGEVELYMIVEGIDGSTPELASAIFKSITFPIPAPEFSHS